MKWVFVTSAIILALILGVVSQEKLEQPIGAQPRCEDAKNKTVHEKIETCGLTAKERATFKGREIAKLPPQARQNVKFSGADYDIEIVNIEAIEGGVQVFARAWNSDGTQIGFGKDGSIDIERFVIINPPVLVEDPSGTIVRVQEAHEKSGIPYKEFNYREDPKEAILQSIVHTISLKKEKFDSQNIQQGKVGNTTTTVYPDADTETTSFDGYQGNDGGSNSWNTVHDTTNTSSFAFPINNDSGNGLEVGFFGPLSDISGRRAMALFDTSSIGSDTVSSATVSLYGKTIVTDAVADDLALVQASPSSNTGLTSTDFDNYGDAIDNPTEGASRIDATVSTSAYSDWTLDATGLTWIDGSGISKFAFRSGDDADDNPVSSGTHIVFHSADASGTTQDPKLVVEHTAAANEYNEDEGGDIIWW